MVGKRVAEVRVSVRVKEFNKLDVFLKIISTHSDPFQPISTCTKYTDTFTLKP